MRARTAKPRGPAVVSRVLEVALEELGRVGLARLSLPKVAVLAGINKTSLYRRWPTKQALVAAALERSVPSERELPDHGSLELDLVDLAAGVAKLVASSEGRGVVRVLFGEGDTPQTRRLAKMMSGTPTRVAPRLVLERAAKRGELRPDADLDLLLYVIAGAVLHRTFVERGRADGPWARRLVHLLIQGAAPRR